MVRIGFVEPLDDILLSQHDEVVALNIAPEKVVMANRNEFPVKDKKIKEYLKAKKLNLTTTLDKKEVYKNANFVIIATPTDYNPKANYFNTKIIEHIITDVLNINPNIIMVNYIQKNKEQLQHCSYHFSTVSLHPNNLLYSHVRWCFQ